jgi:CubicO group peptidase (beta-lactamase class C family)
LLLNWKRCISNFGNILVSEGLIEYDIPIAHYWPAFGQNNKEQITLRHILSHQSGLYDIRNLIEDAREMLNWSHMLQVFEQATPRFAVNQSNAYQALTFGWLVGGALEKATGRGLSD